MPTTRPYRPGNAGRASVTRRSTAGGRSTPVPGRVSIPSRRPSVPGRRPQPRQVGIGGVLQRRPQKRKKNATGVAGMLGALRGALPTGGAAKRSSSSGRGKKGAGVALATAAAGFAFSNRDKLASMLHRDSGTTDATLPGPTVQPHEPRVDVSPMDSRPQDDAGTGTPPAA